MAGSAKDVQAFFERVAMDWDTMRLAYYDERVIEKMAEVAGIAAGSQIADVGTGTGFVAAGLAPRVKRVIGIDNASAMLRVARENLDALSVSNAELLVGDLAGLPLADNSVDAAFANMVLHHAIDPVAMLEEMARIVRPGGTMSSPTRWSIITNGCGRSMPTFGSALLRSRLKTSSVRRG